MELTQEQVQSVNVLLGGCQVAQRRGAYSLQEAHTLQAAIDSLVPREEQERQMREAVEAAQAEESGDLSEGSEEGLVGDTVAGEESDEVGSD